MAGIINGYKKNAVAPANYVACAINIEKCEKCETCAKICVFSAIKIEKKGPVFNNEECMGCGVCAINCSSKVIELIPKKREKMYKNLFDLASTVGKEIH